MKSSIVIEVTRDGIVPSEAEERAQWLEQHGVLPEEVKVSAVAELKSWAAAGANISPDGRADITGCHGNPDVIRNRLRKAIALRLRADPSDRSDFDATEVLDGVAAERADKARKAEAERLEEEARNTAILAHLRELAAHPDLVMDADGQPIPLPENVPQHVQRMISGFVWGSLQIPAVGRDELYVLHTESSARRRACLERKDAEVERSKIALRDWVQVVGPGIGLDATLIRAAAEGRDIISAVEAELRARVGTVIRRLIPEEHVANCCVTNSVFGNEVDKRVPTPRAYAVRDAIVEGASEIAKAAAHPEARVEVRNFERLDVESSNDNPAKWRAGFEVIVLTGACMGDIGWHVLVEPLAFDSKRRD